MAGVMVRTTADLANVMQGRDPNIGGALIQPKSFEDVPVEQIEAFVKEFGLHVEWRRGVSCPCARSDTLQPRGECPHCKGLGTLYPADRRRKTKILMSSRQPNGKPWAVGDLMVGTVALTFLPGDGIPDKKDMIFPQDKDGKPSELHKVKEVIVRAQNQVDPRTLGDRLTIASAAIPKQTPMPERLRYQAGIDIEWLGWEVREGTDSNIVVATTGDYDLVGNEIRWKPGRGPAAGTSYSVVYTAPAAYMVAESTYRAISGVKLPRSVRGIRMDQWDPARDYR